MNVDDLILHSSSLIFFSTSSSSRPWFHHVLPDFRSDATFRLTRLSLTLVFEHNLLKAVFFLSAARSICSERVLARYSSVQGGPGYIGITSAQYTDKKMRFLT